MSVLQRAIFKRAVRYWLSIQQDNPINAGIAYSSNSFNADITVLLPFKSNALCITLDTSITEKQLRQAIDNLHRLAAQEVSRFENQKEEPQ
jgi:hypothetical protein